ncbi:unnamed protein product [Polarella glacialis]|nr:unnamed protein product [Polarella glacialis]
MRTNKLYKSVSLNSKSSKIIHFDCGKTLDFSLIEDDEGNNIPRPYEQQLREGMPEDRNTKHTGNRLPPCDPVLDLQIAEVTKLYEFAITEWPSFSIEDLDDPDSGEAAQKLRDLMHKMMDSGPSKLLGFLYGSQKDLDKVMYELLHYTRCGTGCETFEQFLYFYGKKGSNAKGTRIKFLLKVAGLSTNGGYVGITKASFFQQSKMPSANATDEATAAMEDVKWLLVDEAGSNMTDQGALPQAMNATIMKTFTDIAGTPLPFQRKYGKQENMTVTWGMTFFGNVVMDAKNADDAFKRRPSMMEITARFVTRDDYDPNDKTHTLVNTDYKNDRFLMKMTGEFYEWVRRLYPLLYTVHSRNDSRIMPIPRDVKDFTETELGVTSGGLILDEPSVTLKEFISVLLSSRNAARQEEDADSVCGECHNAAGKVPCLGRRCGVQ